MTSVQENKNELEAAVRYCESAISRAQATIESMEFRQQAASKAWHEQTGREAALEREVAELKDRVIQLVRQNDHLIETSQDRGAELAELRKEKSLTWKQAWEEKKELVALRDDQIAMLERKLSTYRWKTYPFKEGDLYYVINQLDGTWVESVWDDESESMHDNTNVPSHPHKVYFTVDQKNVLDQFKPEDD